MRKLWVFLVFFSAAAQAEVYRCQKDGQPVYTDKPCAKGAKPADLPDINFVGTPGAQRSEREMAKDWDERVAKERKARDQADAAWLKEQESAADKEDRVRSALNARRVVKGMSEEQVRSVLGEPDATLVQEGRENVVIWSYKPRSGPQHTISFRGGEVNSVSSRNNSKKKKS